MLPPGRCRLVTRSLLIGSAPVAKTIGMVAVVALAATADTSPPIVTINKQQELIERLVAKGHSVRDTEGFLFALNGALSAFERHRRLILDQLQLRGRLS